MHILHKLENSIVKQMLLIPAVHWNCGYPVISLWNKIKLSFAMLKKT